MKSSDIFKNVRGKESQKVGLPESSNYFTNQYTLTRRFTLESNRVFKTKAHMLAYIEDRINSDGTISDTVTVDTIKSALPGLILTVINDDENPDNNGMYYIENSDPNNTPGLSANKINHTNDSSNCRCHSGCEENRTKLCNGCRCCTIESIPAKPENKYT